ncbi:hypothetical protein D8674_028388 [Pyrus ussuriensis x Pyrus communis]|uniref:Uncharacterized protein n=1 Tax=Pyrus ussuriensis x Pyrus communis TaxID=2448454 RepID=A0A5N5I108_9ROSA|nr:hypothetical protein D8674_028388 [Pyrus ussuriensis x Pyrus communis]
MRRRQSIMSWPRRHSRARAKRDSSSGPRWRVWEAVAMRLAQTMAAMYGRKNHTFLKKLAERQKMEPMAVAAAAAAMRGCL